MFRCADCGECFQTQNALNSHNAIHKLSSGITQNELELLKQKPYECSECGFQTHKLAEFKGHMEIIHLNQDKNIVKCPICNVFKASKKRLNEHLLTHLNTDGITGINKFPCKCGKSYTRRDSLMKHYRTKTCEHGRKVMEER